MASFSAGAAWLIVVISTCITEGVTNEASMSEGQRSFMSRINAHLHNTTAIGLETEAKDDFVRRCRVATTVSHKSFLPTQALDSFCSETDAVVECKLQMAKMKSVHSRDKDMGIFCLDIFQWFMQKYGMNCPMQCEKMQCRGTCFWLKVKKSLDEEGKELAQRSNSTAEKRHELDNFLKTNATLNTKRKEQERKTGFAYAEFVYAEANFSEQQNYTLHALQREQEMSAKVAEWERQLLANKTLLNEAEDALTKKVYALQSAEQQHKFMLQGVDKTNMTLQGLLAEGKVLEAKITELEQTIPTKQGTKSDLEKVLEEQKKLIVDQEKAVTDAEAALKTAEDTAKAQGTDAAEELVANKEEDLTKEKYKLHMMVKNESSIANSVTFTQNDIDADNAELDEFKKDFDSKEASAQQTSSSVDQQKLDADNYLKDDIGPLKTEVADLQTSVAKLTAETDKLEQTVEYWTKAEGERRRTRERMEEGEKEARTKADAKKKVLSEEEGTLDDIEFEIKQNTKVFKELDALFQAELESLGEERLLWLKKVKEHNNAKPDIVTIHQLG
mmetsp:Transcript_70763/g.133673  ORF Transcript_70763/g.133673 Transcript_70763/m.133673 type:complete len:558 (-) Transcript_70763:117-1790(-)